MSTDRINELINESDQVTNKELKEEQWRIWIELCKILPVDDYGNLEQGDEVYKIVFNANL